MKSRTVEARPLSRIKGITDAVSRDRLPLFAAQSSFYICISAIPLSMLTVSLANLIAPDMVSDLVGLIRGAVPKSSLALFDLVLEDIEGKAAAPFVSTFALSSLWAASRGVRSVMKGLSEVYERKPKGSSAMRALKGVIYTALFVVMITAALILLVFGEYLKGTASGGMGGVPMFIRYKEILLFLILSVFFSSLYSLAAGGTVFGAGREEFSSFRYQYAGGAVAAAGWILFSFFFSLYFELFPRFSYLYGSLAAVVFLMLWVYFCMLILLAGAEINKYLNSKRK